MRIDLDWLLIGPHDVGILRRRCDTKGWHEVKRDINRGKVDYYQIDEALKDQTSLNFQVFNGIKNFLNIRKHLLRFLAFPISVSLPFH